MAGGQAGGRNNYRTGRRRLKSIFTGVGTVSGPFGALLFPLLVLLLLSDTIWARIGGLWDPIEVILEALGVPLGSL